MLVTPLLALCHAVQFHHLCLTKEVKCQPEKPLVLCRCLVSLVTHTHTQHAYNTRTQHISRVQVHLYIFAESLLQHFMPSVSTQPRLLLLGLTVSPDLHLKQPGVCGCVS